MMIADLFEETAAEESVVKNVVHPGGLRSVAWTGTGRDDRPGWWWAVVFDGSAEVQAMGWAPLSDAQRNADIAAAIVRVLYQPRQAVA